jgi:hypothetical protein
VKITQLNLVLTSGTWKRQVAQREDCRRRADRYHSLIKRVLGFTQFHLAKAT